MRTKPCDPGVRQGRLAKASRFLQAAEAVETLLGDDDAAVDPAVTLYVHAGIAAADALCCARLGVHAQGRDHGEALELLARADTSLVKHLRLLLEQKARAGYSHLSPSPGSLKRAARAARRLVEEAAQAMPTT